MSGSTAEARDRAAAPGDSRGIAARVRADTPLRGVRTVLARELRSFFATPTAWTILALAALLVGALLLLLVLRPGEPATLRPVMSAAAWILILLAPAVSMRALSEELRFGTWEVLLSTPVTSGGVVVGKFLACLAVLVVLGAPLVVAGGVLELHGRPDWGEIACGLLGLLLAGGAFVAFGILASALTSSQLVAYLLSLFFWLSIALAGRLLPPVLPVDVADAVLALDPTRRLEEFVIGLFDTGNVVAFVALTIAFLVAATVSLERRRCSASRGARARAARTTIGLIGTAAAALAVAAVAQLPQLRASFDLTRTRAYSLAEPTRDLLRSLEGDWSITLLAIESENDPAIMRQVDEVLDRVREIRPSLRTDRIDPLDASSVGAFEDLLDRLRAAYATEVAAHEAAIDDAVRAQAALADFALDELPRLRAAIASMPADDSAGSPNSSVSRSCSRSRPTTANASTRSSAKAFAPMVPGRCPTTRACARRSSRTMTTGRARLAQPHSCSGSARAIRSPPRSCAPTRSARSRAGRRSRVSTPRRAGVADGPRAARAR